MADSLKQGYYIQCPVIGGHRHSVSGGKLRLKESNLLTSRELCLARAYEDCDLCPNRDFIIEVKPIGSDKDYKWLSTVMKNIAKLIDAEVVHNGRSRKQCCLEHGVLPVSEFAFHLNPTSVANRDTGRMIYDAIMKASSDSPHSVIHVIIRRSIDRFDVAVAVEE